LLVACSSSAPAGAPGGDDGGSDATLTDATSPADAADDAGGGADGGQWADAGAGTGSDAAPPCDTSKPFGALVALAELNTEADDWAEHLSADELTIAFASKRGTDGGAAELWIAGRGARTAPFDPPIRVSFAGLGVNTWDPALSPDGLTLYFVSDPNAIDAIYVATRSDTSAAFGTPTPVSALDTAGSIYDPCVTLDGAEMWLTSNRADAGTRDIYRSTITPQGFGVPVAETEVNSGTSEQKPGLTADRLTLFWASVRGDGGAKADYDIWAARRTSVSAPFGELAPVDELNSASNDLTGWVSADGCRLYVSSDRPDAGAGGLDMYVAERPR
jgi:hypothetical protein